MSETIPFFVDRAKGGRASCKGCKSNCPGGELRIAKVVASPYGDNQQMKSWHHVDCFMNSLIKQRPTTKRVDSIDDIGNWENITKDDQEFILKKLNETEKLYAEKNSGKYTAKVIKNECTPSKVTAISIAKESTISSDKVKTDDDNFSMFFKLCKKISRVDAYTEKTAAVNNFFMKGSDNNSFKGNLALWCKLLLPQVTKRVYNLRSKQLIKLFSRIFSTDHDDMLTRLEQGDIAETIQHFFSKSRILPASESTLTIHEVENFLEDLSKLTKEEEQIYHFKKIVKKCTLDDMKMLIRLIKGDLRINAGPKHILEGVHPDAYNAFQTSRDLNMVLDRVLSQSSGVKHKDLAQRSVTAKISIMTPVLPMLAEACKSIEMAMKKCPNGMFSEIKYDGERVQVHKKGNEFKYFSRALKPVMAHKVSHFKDYLPKAFPKGVDLILDAEVLMVDVNTGKPLPFGTLGVHKQSEFKDAQVCLYVFDCLYYNGQVLIDMPIRKRRQFLHENMVEVTNHVMFSEQKLIEKPADLAKMIAEVLELGLEGLVLKDLESTYDPGKRHWLKVKKDYLFDGAMADTADLVVLGSWFGTGKKGGMMSVFLMGCLDTHRNRWVTVTKVHTGHDDSTLERLQKELSPLMVKISQDNSKIPSWLDCNKGMVPDFVALDPKKQPIWEITGTELTKANLHTADGISVRFPRVTRIRTDKNWDSATNLDELKHLYKTSKEKTDVSLLNKLAATASESYEPTKKKIKASPSKVSKIDRFLTKESKRTKNDIDSSNASETSCSTSFDETDKKNSRKRKIDDKDKDSNSTETTPDTSFEKTDQKNAMKRRRDDTKGSNPSESTPDTSFDTKDKKEGIKNTSETKFNRSFDETYQTNAKKWRKYDIKDSHSSETSPDTSDGTRYKKKDIKNTSKMNSNTNSDETNQKNAKKRRKYDTKDSHSSETRPDTSDGDGYKKKEIKMTSKTSSNTNVDETDQKKAKQRRKSSQSSDTSPDISVNERDTKEDTEFQLLPKDPLPDTFKGKRLGFYPDFISFPEIERRHFERHWIAYGGNVVKSIRHMDVDYVVHNSNVIEFQPMQKLKEKTPPEVRHVAKDWLIKCINDVKLYDTMKYAVFVKP